MSCDGSFAQDHLFRIDVVVDCVERLPCRDTGALQQDLRHFLAVSAGKALAHFDIVQVILQVRAVEEAQILRDHAFLSLPLDLLQSCLDLFFPALLLVGADDLIPLFKVFFFPFAQLNSQLLVEFSDLFSKVAASTVYDKILNPVRGLIDLDEMVSAPQCSQAALKALRVFEIPVAAKLLKVKMLLSSFPHIHAGRNKVGRLIEFLIINICFSEVNRIHSASDIHSHNIGNCLIRNGHGRTDRAALTRVHIRHDADPAARSEFIVAHAADLLDCFLFDHGSIAYGCIDLTFNL